MIKPRLMYLSAEIRSAAEQVAERSRRYATGQDAELDGDLFFAEVCRVRYAIDEALWLAERK